MPRTPKKTETEKDVPQVSENKKMPEVNDKALPAPKVGNEDNMVQFGSKLIEIKPTKIRYQRDRTAGLYQVLKQINVMEFLMLPDNYFEKAGDKRSPDKMLFDWLIAVTDDTSLVIDNYDKLDIPTIERLLEIFCRINKLPGDKDEKKE